MQYNLFNFESQRVIAIGFKNNDSANGLVLHNKIFFVVREISSSKRNVIMTFDIEGRILNIKLGNSNDSIEVKILERSFDGTFYIYIENLKNLINNQSHLYLYFDYYEQKVIKDNAIASLLVSQVIEFLKRFIMDHDFSSVCFTDINDSSIKIRRLSRDVQSTIYKIVCLYDFSGLEKEKLFFSKTYSTRLDVLPPEVRPDINPEYIIIQLTHGCIFKISQGGGCGFCNSYLPNYYYEKNESELSIHIDDVKAYCKGTWSKVDKVFLSDADPLNTRIRSKIYLDILNDRMPHLKGIECFVTTNTILSKNVDEWKCLMQCGLKKLYWGVESADDQTLELIGKYHTNMLLRRAAELINTIGIDYSVILMSGVGALSPERTDVDVYENSHITETFKFVEEFDCKELYISKFVPIDGTKLYDLFKCNKIKFLDSDELELQHRMMIKSFSKNNRVIKGSYGIQFVNEMAF